MTPEGTIICGLVGVAGEINAKEEGVFKRLLELDTIRGPHSTGIYGVDARGEDLLVKKVGTPWDLMEYKAYDDVFRKRLTVLMGHNRWATKGKVNSTNAHPFEHDHIVGAHNGTLRNQTLLIDHKEFEVDSDNIFYSISKEGVDETVKNLSGAFALTWWDKEQETMNFVRNSERPLWVCISENGKTIFWASEPWMLEVTLRLANIKHRALFEPAVGMLYSYPIQVVYQPKELDPPTIRQLELYTYFVPKTQGHHVTNRGGNSHKNVFDKAKEVTVTEKKTQGISAADLMSQGKVEFFVSSEAETATGQRYIKGVPTQDDCDVEVRIYAEHDTKLWTRLIESSTYFNGVVRSFASVSGTPSLSYVVLDPRTIEESSTPIDADMDEEMAVIYGGKVVNEVDFDEAVLGGCCNCKQIVFIEDSEDIVWLDAQNYVCQDCKDLPVVKDFIKQSIETDAVKH